VDPKRPLERTTTHVSTATAAPTLVIVLQNRAALLQRYLDDVPGGGLFVPGNSSLRVGESVQLDIAFADDLVTLQVPGVVRWKRMRGDASLPAGIGIAFTDPGGQLGPYLKQVALGQGRPLKARARRFRVAMPVLLTAQGRMLSGQTRDLSRTGMFVAGAGALPLTTEVSVRLLPPGKKPLEARAKVVRTGTTGVGLLLAQVDDPRSFGDLISELQAQQTPTA
jgi:Tfp pilus assembly protein PilZ